MEKSEQMLQQADELLAAKEYMAASKSFSVGIEQFPNDYRFFWGALRAETEDFQRAEKSHEAAALYRQAMVLVPDEVRSELADAYQEWTNYIALKKEENERRAKVEEIRPGHKMSLDVDKEYRNMNMPTPSKSRFSIPQPVAFLAYFLLIIIVYIGQVAEADQIGFIIAALVGIGVLFVLIVVIWNAYIIFRNRLK
ncbi:MAG: hypothetical protein GXY06_06285 [Clostridiaceae bacterium]|nr:hypothetical protein [Clostridiaceae bacterium]